MPKLLLIALIFVCYGCENSTSTYQINLNTENLTMRQYLKNELVEENSTSKKMDMIFTYISEGMGFPPDSWEKAWENGKNDDCAFWICGDPDSSLTFYFFSNFPPPK